MMNPKGSPVKGAFLFVYDVVTLWNMPERKIPPPDVGVAQAQIEAASTMEPKSRSPEAAQGRQHLAQSFDHVKGGIMVQMGRPLTRIEGLIDKNNPAAEDLLEYGKTLEGAREDIDLLTKNLIILLANSGRDGLLEEVARRADEWQDQQPNIIEHRGERVMSNSRLVKFLTSNAITDLVKEFRERDENQRKTER